MTNIMNITTKESSYKRIINILSESWRLVPGLKWPIFKRGLLIFFITVIVVSTGLYVDIHFGWPKFMFRVVSFVAGLIALIINMKLWVPVLMMGVRRAIGLPIDLRVIKLECAKVQSTLFQLIILYALISDISLNARMLLFGKDIHWSIPGSILRVVWDIVLLFVLTPMTIFAFPLVITQKLTVSAALASAYEKMWANWVIVLGTSILLFILTAAVFFALIFISKFMPPAIGFIFIIALTIVPIWLLPMLILIGGILFRDLYGILSISQGKCNNSDLGKAIF